MKNNFLTPLKLTLSIALLVSSKLLGTPVTPATLEITNDCNSSVIVECQPNKNSEICAPSADGFYVKTGSIADNGGMAKLTFSPDANCYNYVCRLSIIVDQSFAVVEPGTNYSCYISLKTGTVNRCELNCTP